MQTSLIDSTTALTSLLFTSTNTTLNHLLHCLCLMLSFAFSCLGPALKTRPISSPTDPRPHTLLFRMKILQIILTFIVFCFLLFLSTRQQTSHKNYSNNTHNNLINYRSDMPPSINYLLHLTLRTLLWSNLFIGNYSNIILLFTRKQQTHFHSSSDNGKY